MFVFDVMCRPQGYRRCQGIYGPWIRKGSQEGEGLGHVLNGLLVVDREPMHPRHPGAMLPAPRCNELVPSLISNEDFAVHVAEVCLQ